MRRCRMAAFFCPVQGERKLRTGVLIPLFHFPERLMILRSFCQWTVLWTAIVCLAAACGSARAAHSFRFQSNLHGATVTGQSSVVVTEGAYGMSLTAGPVGAVLNET